jgi:hypothetical protein
MNYKVNRSFIDIDMLYVLSECHNKGEIFLKTKMNVYRFFLNPPSLIPPHLKTNENYYNFTKSNQTFPKFKDMLKFVEKFPYFAKTSNKS